MENWKLQLTAIEALSKKYGFCPAPQHVTLLESDGEGTYILFRVGEHEYHCEDGAITNVEDQKDLDAEISNWIEISRMKEADIVELREQKEKQEKQFVTKELMLTEAYNAKRMEIEEWKGRMRLLQTLADDRKKEIERLEEKLEELKKTADQWFKDAQKNQSERDEWKERYESVMKNLTTEED